MTPSQAYPYEKAKFIGNISCAVSYGILIALFFRCMGALFSPVNRTSGSLKGLLVAHTVAMFLFATIYTAVNLEIISVAYINGREYPGMGEVSPGPFGYQYIAFSQARGIISSIVFLLNNWLADGLFVYRCYIIYAMNYWAILIPCLIYLATFVTGIILVYYQISHPTCTIWRSSPINIGIPYSLSVSLTAIVTIMIIARLVLLSRAIQNAMNAPFRLTGLYTTVVTMLSESSTLYAVTFVLFIGTWAADSPAEYFFFPVLAQTQVIAPFLIILRVANRRALTRDIVSGDIDPISIARGQSTEGSGSPPVSLSENSMDMDGRLPAGLGDRVASTVDLHL